MIYINAMRSLSSISAIQRNGRMGGTARLDKSLNSCKQKAPVLTENLCRYWGFC